MKEIIKIKVKFLKIIKIIHFLIEWFFRGLNMKLISFKIIAFPSRLDAWPRINYENLRNFLSNLTFRINNETRRSNYNERTARTTSIDCFIFVVVVFNPFVRWKVPYLSRNEISKCDTALDRFSFTHEIIFLFLFFSPDVRVRNV